METLKSDSYKELKYDEENNVFIVEYIDEIQIIRGCSDTFGDEVEFDSKEDAIEFYYSLEEPKVYHGIYNENGFVWR